MPRVGRDVSIPYYGIPNGDLVDTGGSYVSNGDRGRDYLGYSISFTKRLANRWMARGFYQYGKGECSIPRSYYDHASPLVGRAGCQDGDLYLTRSTGSGKGERFLQSTWTYSLNGMYQVAPDRPWGFNVSANLTGREGYPLAYWNNSVVIPWGAGVARPTINVIPGQDYDQYRLDDIQTVDFRVREGDRPSGSGQHDLRRRCVQHDERRHRPRVPAEHAVHERRQPGRQHFTAHLPLGRAPELEVVQNRRYMA